jgi:hypothetical protein
VTWAQLSAPWWLEIFIASRTDDQIDYLVRRLSGPTAALGADKIGAVKPYVAVTEEMRGAALARRDQLQGV